MGFCFLTYKFELKLNMQVLVSIVDVSAGEKEVENCGEFKFVSRREVLSCYNSSGGQLPEDRGKAIEIMNKALENFLQKVHGKGILAGVVGLGGSGGTSLLSSGFRSLPIGIPKVIVSTMASGQTEPYIGTSDLVLFPSVVDICGINSVSRVVLSNAGSAFAGMVIGRIKSSGESSMGENFTVGITMFGVTTPCVTAVKERLIKEGYEPLIFHATGVGGRAMEDLVRGGFIQVPFLCSLVDFHPKLHSLLTCVVPLVSCGFSVLSSECNYVTPTSFILFPHFVTVVLNINKTIDSCKNEKKKGRKSRKTFCKLISISAN